jgi:hypothetical protein
LELEVSVKGSDVMHSLLIPISGNDVSQRANVTNSATTGLEIEVSVPTSVRARPQRTVNFIPRKVTPKKSTTTTTSQPTIEISEPD